MYQLFFNTCTLNTYKYHPFLIHVSYQLFASTRTPNTYTNIIPS